MPSGNYWMSSIRNSWCSLKGSSAGSFPEGFKLYKNAVTGEDGEKSFQVHCGISASLQDEVAPLDNIEKRFLSLDESDLTREIRALNNDFSDGFLGA